MLVNNAGIVTGKPFLEADDHRMVKTMEVNTISNFWTTKAFLPGTCMHACARVEVERGTDRLCVCVCV